MQNVVMVHMKPGQARGMKQVAATVESRKAADAAKTRQIVGAPVRKTKVEPRKELVGAGVGNDVPANIMLSDN